MGILFTMITSSEKYINVNRSDWIFKFQDTSDFNSNLFKTIPEKCFLVNNEKKNIYNHMRRIYNEQKKLKNQKVPNYIDSLFSEKIDFQTFLIKQHNIKIEETSQMFIFKDFKTFSEVYYFILEKKLSKVQISERINHEMEHYKKAKESSIEAYFCIMINDVLSDGSSWDFSTHSSIIFFIERKASKENWTKKKYISVYKDICCVTTMSGVDSLAFKTFERFEKFYNLENTN